MEISVIVPVYNGGLKVRRCIRALQRQKTKRAYEIIIVDDGSTDGSLNGFRGNSVRVLRQDNLGPATARNLGVENACGDVILFTDADCEPLDDWVEQMVCCLDDRCISGVKGTYLTRQEDIVARFVQAEYEAKYERMESDPYIDFIDTYAAGFRKEDFMAVGQYDTRFPTASVEDQEFSFRMWEKGGRMVFNPEAQVYHTHSDTLWHYMRKKFRIGFWKIPVLRRHPKKITRDSHTPQSLKFEMAFAMLCLLSLFLLPVGSSFLSFALFFTVCFFITTFPFVLKLFKEDPVVAFISPILLFVRAISLSVGLLVGGLPFCGSWAKLNGEVGNVPEKESTESRRAVSAISRGCE